MRMDSIRALVGRGWPLRCSYGVQHSSVQLMDMEFQRCKFSCNSKGAMRNRERFVLLSCKRVDRMDAKTRGASGCRGWQ
mgnify:CR=1 FL=1